MILVELPYINTLPVQKPLIKAREVVIDLLSVERFFIWTKEETAVYFKSGDAVVVVLTYEKFKAIMNSINKIKTLEDFE